MLDTQLRYETSLSLISILTFTPNGTEIVSLKFISFDKFSISIFQFPFCEKSIVGLLKIKFSYNSSNEITVTYERRKHKIDEIIKKIKNAGMEINDISTDEGNLEDVFIDLTKS